MNCTCGRSADAGNDRECRTCFQARLKTITFAYHPSVGRGMGSGANRRWDSRLERYARARKQGMQPRNTSHSAVDEAYRLSDERQQAFRADRGGGM